MKRSLLLPLLLNLAPACHAPAPSPYPDAAARTGLTLQATPDSLLIRPSSTKLVTYTLRDDQNQAVPFQTVEFSLSTEAGTNPPAWLSNSTGLTNARGEVVLQIIAKPLPSGDESQLATLSAQTAGAAPLTMDLLVSVNNFSARILPKADAQLLGLNSVVNVRLTLFDSTHCADLNLAKLPPSTRPARDALPGADALFAGLSQVRNHAVAGIGYDAKGTMRIGGCLDLPGKALKPNETVRATLFLNQVLPALAGTYNLLSEFRFATARPTTAKVRTAWEQLAYCPYDPARLWLDCTMDALSPRTAANPLDCVPLAGRGGEIGDLIEERRGITTAPLRGDVKDSPCHDRADAKGQTSLEIMVDALFANSRSQLLTTNLPALASEIETLLSAIQLHSLITLSDSGEVNRYFLDHALASVSFPHVSLASIIPLVDVLAPVTRVTGLLAIHRREQLTIPRHEFTLRLGSVAIVAFQNSSLRARGIPTIEQLVSSVFAFAEFSSNGSLFRGCDALDAMICDEINRPRECLFSACVQGLSALEQNLRNSFLALNQPGFDFTLLSGAASVLDTDNDGQAEALGTLDFPGTWSAEFSSTTESAKIFGSWTATPQDGAGQ